MQRILRRSCSALALGGLACSDTAPQTVWHQDPEYLAELQRRVDELPTPEELEGLRTNTWGEPAAFDIGAQHFEEVQDKNTLPLIYGWAVRGSLRERCVNSLGQPITPCEFHLEPDDFNYDSLVGADFNRAVLGRCGATDLSASPVAINFANLPCIYPSTSGNKVWTWQWDSTSCGGDTAHDDVLRSIARSAFRDRMAELGQGTGFSFAELVSLPGFQTADIVIYCATGAQRTGMTAIGTEAASFPFGPLSFQHAVPQRIEETCSEDGTTKRIQIADEAWTYGQARIVLNWDFTWNVIRGEQTIARATIGGGSTTCAAQEQADDDYADHAWKTLLTHEMGHVLGFVHQNDTTDNVMSSPLSCELLSRSPGFRQNMKDALLALSIPDNAPSLTVLSTDLSCYRPDTTSRTYTPPDR